VQLSRSELYSNAMYVHLCTKRLAARVYESRPQRRNEEDSTAFAEIRTITRFQRCELSSLPRAQVERATPSFSQLYKTPIFFHFARNGQLQVSTDSTASQPTRKQTKKTPLHKDACNILRVILIAENAVRRRCSTGLYSSYAFSKSIVTGL
jgi:hypothetical protein